MACDVQTCGWLFQVGDVAPISAVAEMEFYAIEPEQYLIWGGIDDTSSFILALHPADDTQTRLISRFRWSYDLTKPQELPLQLLTEVTDHLAVRKILMGVKGRVEGNIEPLAITKSPFPGVGRPGGDARCGDTHNLGVLHWQLAGYLFGLANFNKDFEVANDQDPAGTQELLYGGSMG